MQQLINWVEIPATDFERAVSFYKNILEAEIHEAHMFGTRMGFFPSSGNLVSGAIVQGEGYRPSAEGTMVYLNGGSDLQPVLDRVLPAGGKVLVPKTQINAEMGYFGIFLDSEGNKMAVHSIH